MKYPNIGKIGEFKIDDEDMTTTAAMLFDDHILFACDSKTSGAKPVRRALGDGAIKRRSFH